MDFASLRPSEPDLDSLRPQVAALCAAVAPDADLPALLGRWNDLRKPIYTWLAWVNLRYRQDTTDEAIAAEKKRRDAFAAAWELEELAVHRGLLDLGAPVRVAVAGQTVAKWEAEVASVDPTIQSERQAESDLGTAYTKLLAAASFEVDGEFFDLSSIAGPATSADRALRERACRAQWAWFASQGAELDRIFDELTSLRVGMAAKLGHADFVETGYRRMNRVDYGQEDVARFRAAVREHLVPLGQKLRQRQAAELGIERVMLWDEGVLHPDGNAQPVPVERMLQAGREAFARLDPSLSGFYDALVADGYIDLPARSGKAPGGFCTYLPDAGRPFVFCNATGVERNVRTLVHEVGHAFQKFASKHITQPELFYATADAAEIHSMALEFLAWPVMDEWFGRDTQRYQQDHLAGAVLFLPYGLLVDEFQHVVYQQPGLDPAGRRRAWQTLERSWLPWRNHGDLPHADGGFWQGQRHIYAWPFYYVDYCLAQMVALQFWALAQTDQADAMDRYVALCARGGSLPFQALVRTTGLDSPFDEGVVAGVAAQVAAALDL